MGVGRGIQTAAIRESVLVDLKAFVLRSTLPMSGTWILSLWLLALPHTTPVSGQQLLGPPAFMTAMTHDCHLFYGENDVAGLASLMVTEENNGRVDFAFDGPCAEVKVGGFYDGTDPYAVYVRRVSKMELEFAIPHVHEKSVIVTNTMVHFTKVDYGSVLDAECEFVQEHLAVGVVANDVIVTAVCGDHWGFVRSRLDRASRQLHPPHDHVVRIPIRTMNGERELLTFGAHVSGRGVRLLRWFNNSMLYSVSFLHDLDKVISLSVNPMPDNTDTRRVVEVVPFFSPHPTHADSFFVKVFAVSILNGREYFAMEPAKLVLQSSTEDPNEYTGRFDIDYDTDTLVGKFSLPRTNAFIFRAFAKLAVSESKTSWNVIAEKFVHRRSHVDTSQNATTNSGMAHCNIVRKLMEKQMSCTDEQSIAITMFVVAGVEALILVVLLVLVIVCSVLRPRGNKPWANTKGKKTKAKDASSPTSATARNMGCSVVSNKITASTDVTSPSVNVKRKDKNHK